MRSAVVIILPTFIVQFHGAELEVKHTTGTQDFTDTLVHKLVKKAQLLHSGLKNTTLLKVLGLLTLPGVRSAVRRHWKVPRVTWAWPNARGTPGFPQEVEREDELKLPYATTEEGEVEVDSGMGEAALELSSEELLMQKHQSFRPASVRPNRPRGPPRSTKQATRPKDSSSPGILLKNARPGPQTRSSMEKMQKKYLFRHMEMRDVAAVYHLGLDIFTAKEYPALYRTWDEFAVVEYLSTSRQFCFVAESIVAHDESSKNEIVAFILGETIVKRTTGTRGYVEWVAVHPDYRRSGIATALINSFLAVARKASAMRLLADTPTDNTPAINLFDKIGLCYKTDHLYLTSQVHMNDEEDGTKRRVDEDGVVSYTYTSQNHTHITIRNARVDDLHPIYTLGEQIFLARSVNLYNFWDEDTVLEMYQSDAEFCVVATSKEPGEDGEEDKVIGFALGTTIQKPRSSWKYGYLVWLGCAPGYQRLGVASQLYDVMVELFAQHKVRMVIVDTQQNNEPALKFFRKHGFGHEEEHIYLCNQPLTIPNVTLSTPTKPKTPTKPDLSSPRNQQARVTEPTKSKGPKRTLRGTQKPQKQRKRSS